MNEQNPPTNPTPNSNNPRLIDDVPSKANSGNMKVKDLVQAFIMPTVVGKSLILYFGLGYSEEPSRGYGIGLVLSIAFTVIMLIRFVWKYRDYEE